GHAARRPDPSPAGETTGRWTPPPWGIRTVQGYLDRFLRWRRARTVMQLPLFAAALAMIAHGLLGPQLAPKNLATVLTWVHYRGVLVLVLLATGNLFCMACPFMLPRQLARRFFQPARHWPRRLRSKWLAVGLFVLILFAYELFDLWSSPWWTAWLIVAYFAAALAVDSVFRNASFCKWVCPIGQFNFAAATLSPLEVAIREPDVCATCKTFDCIRGTRHPEEPALVVLPGSELWQDPRRSGIGRFSKRKDVAALMLLFTFGALLNAFGMVSPVYTVETWLAGLMGTKQEAVVLSVVFLWILVLEPVLLLG